MDRGPTAGILQSIAMARRRSHPIPMPSASSSADFEENISLMVVSNSHHRSHGSEQPASFTVSLKRSLLRRCHISRLHLSSTNKLKMALICFISVAMMMVALIIIKPSRLNFDNTQTSVNNLRAPTAQNNTASSGDPKIHSNDSQNNELLDALYELPLPTTYKELDELNEEFVDLDPRFILKWAHHHLATPHLVQVTSFGPTGLVILHLLSQLHLLKDVPVITLNTLHLFPESYEFYEAIQSYYKNRETDDSDSKEGALELVITKPLRIEYPPGMNGDGVIEGVIESRNEFDAIYGSTLWKTDPPKYTKLTKIDPLNKALDERQVHMWITGRRRSSGGERSSMDVLEFEMLESSVPVRDNGKINQPFDLRRGRWKLNPLAYWTYEQVWDYIRKQHKKLPYNVLYDKGYTSLGDEMTTDLPQSSNNATGDYAVDAFERSGRFMGMGNRTECGLHSHIRKVKEQKQQALEAGEEFNAPTLICDECVDLSVDNFENKITTVDEGRELLVEFYSPYCGGCQEFAPTLNKLANHLSLNVPKMQVARFDITENEIPHINDEELFQVEVTPTLYRVRYTPSFHVEFYKGKHDFDSILRWLTVTSTTDEEAAGKRKVDILRRKERGRGKRLGGSHIRIS
mmetsp:Transcript_11829/g.20802  ORF Transcript_11829/g.20802 Transcript_11829/m.20802 type:complete len:631 (-) Transcript_11829:706-2598(-)